MPTFALNFSRPGAHVAAQYYNFLRLGFEGYRQVHQTSERLRGRGWQVPAYTFPEDMTDTAVIRIVVCNGFSRDLAGLLLEDLRRQVALLDADPYPHVALEVSGAREGFTH
jgi:glutamate decarboxylase